MNVLNIVEYSSMSLGGNMGVNPAVQSHIVEFGSNPATSDKLDYSTLFVRLIADASCAIKFNDTDPEIFLPGGEAEYFALTPGQPRSITVVEL